MDAPCGSSSRRPLHLQKKEEDEERRKVEEQEKLKTMTEKEEEGTGEAGTSYAARRACAAPHGRAGDAGSSLQVGS